MFTTLSVDWHCWWACHYNDVIIGAMAYQITSVTIVYPTFYSGADQRKYQRSASLAFVRGIHRWPVNSPHKWPVTRKMFPFDGDIIYSKNDAKYASLTVVRWLSPKQCRMVQPSLILHLSPLSAASIRHWTESVLVQVMASRRTGDKPLHEPNFSEILIKIQNLFLNESFYQSLGSKPYFYSTDLTISVIFGELIHINCGDPVSSIKMHFKCHSHVCIQMLRF